MNELHILNIDGIECYEKGGTVYLKLETVARGLGFVDNSKGVEYVRWNTVRQYLKDIGFSQEVAKDDFIPENVFYRLAMKAKNEVAEKFQAKVADEIIPSIRKHGCYGKPMTVLDQIKLLAQGSVEMERKIEKVNNRMDLFERDMPLYGCEIEDVKGHVNRKGVVYSDIYGQLKREFGAVSSYKSIKRRYLADVHEFIDCYEPPFVLSEQIKDENR